MNLYIVRHGTTCWNEIGRTQGRSQNRLSEKGKVLVNETADKLKDVKIDVIYSSPLMRTMQTANILNQYHKLKINKNDLLLEYDEGIFTGRLKSELTKTEQELKASRHPSTKMESFEQVFERVKEFYETVLKSETHENILVVSHDIICHMLELILKNIKSESLYNDYKCNFKNAEVRKYKM